jgi:hypothetical protein
MKARSAGLTMVMVAVMLGALASFAGPASAASAPKIARTIDQDGWAGYSAYPVKGFIVDEEADWGIPQVSCPISLEKPRAAVWVGMWGSINSLKDETGWLPQIGTVSGCNGPVPYYRLAWEMYSQVKGGGNVAQSGLDCPGDKTYSLCGNLTSISPGDVVNAAVDFEGPYTAKPAIRKFEIRMTDLTTGDYAVGQIATNKRITIGQAAYQAGVIVEDNPPSCALHDLITGTCLLHAKNGLAHFAAPITIGTAQTLLGGAPASTTLRYIKWVMKLQSNGHQLAQDGQLAIVDDTMNYTVTWLRRN